jgi:hypothetical protein
VVQEGELQDKGNEHLDLNIFSGSADDFQNQRGYSYFRSIVKDIFIQYVDRIAQICKEKCMNEIACTQVIYWELNK